MAGTVEYYVRQSHDGNVLAGYKGALWFGVGLSVAGFICKSFHLEDEEHNNQLTWLV